MAELLEYGSHHTRSINRRLPFVSLRELARQGNHLPARVHDDGLGFDEQLAGGRVEAQVVM